jgi:hypothetical protein
MPPFEDTTGAAPRSANGMTGDLEKQNGPKDHIVQIDDSIHKHIDEGHGGGSEEMNGNTSHLQQASSAELLRVFRIALGIPIPRHATSDQPNGNASGIRRETGFSYRDTAPNNVNSSSQANYTHARGDASLTRALFSFHSDNETGIYHSIIKSERDSHVSYIYYRTILTTFLLMQVILGATLTALGASSSSHTTITVVSAILTVLAGTLAILKGRGLPERFRKDLMAWRDVRDYIWEREGEIAAGMWDTVDGRKETKLKDGELGFATGLEGVWREIRTVQSMYAAVRKTQENNRPDSYVVVPGGKSF